VTGARGEYAGTIQLDTVIATIQQLRVEHTNGETEEASA
jgi:osmoprotectant transport system ATP-binding protein